MVRRIVATLFGMALVAACASTPRPQVRGAVRLAPGERAQGTATLEPGAPVTLRMVNNGPGRADFVIRAAGIVLQQGALTDTESRLVLERRTALVVVLESAGDQATVVRWDLVGQEPAFAWDFGR